MTLTPKLAEAVRGWQRTTPWAWSLDTMIAGHVPSVEIGGVDTTGMDSPYVEGDRVVVGPMWWDTHTVEERRQALMDAVRWGG